MKSFFLHLRDIILLPITMAGIIPFLIYRHTPSVMAPYFSVKCMGVLLATAGLFLFFQTIFLFVKIGKGTLAPWTAKEKLIIEGPYAYCRNPMISAVLMIIIAESLLLCSLNILIWAFIFFGMNTIYFIMVEEPFLDKKFGKNYKIYKAQVPRWLPKPFINNECV